MPDFGGLLRSAPRVAFSGTVYRLCPARFAASLISMRGSLLHGARYNIRGYFGALYTSLSPEIARREMARYYTVPPIAGFVEASVELQLSRVVDVTDGDFLQGAGIGLGQLSGSAYLVTQEIGRQAWENGIEGLLAPSAVDPADRNLVVFLDNHYPPWRVKLEKVEESRFQT